MTHDPLGREWWRAAVIYQVYPRSFADASGDGIGDLPGITSRLPHLAELGVDAVWLSPFYRSPQRDGGYDVSDYRDVDPLFGTLEDFTTLLHRAHELGLRVIVDIVPNHSSSEHAWFQAALAAGPGSDERARYIFREGRAGGDEPPNNWESVFGGPAWTRVTEPGGTPRQWYLHLFDSSQPDLDWSNPWVADEFDKILEFWLDLGVDGFRIDVANGLIKADGLPDWFAPTSSALPNDVLAGEPPFWAQEGVHPIWRRWRRIVEKYEGERVLVAEAWVNPLSRMAQWVRPDELHQAFNFGYLLTEWNPLSLSAVIDESLAAFGDVGAPSTWVLSNHDTVRHTARLALGEQLPHGVGIGPLSPEVPDEEVGLRRARAATMLMLALPGSAYLFQGEELGLPEATGIPDDARQDPTWFRTQGERYGRDGCRVPLPWEADAPAYGFSPTGATWLPQPASWARYATDMQQGVEGSTLELYRAAIALRRDHELGFGELTWLEVSDAALGFRVNGVEVWTNFSHAALPLPAGEAILASGEIGGSLPPDTTVWLAAQ
jgi:alpha-glucosidase